MKSIEVPNELWKPLCERIDKLVERVELIALAVDGLAHGGDFAPRADQGAVNTVVIALDELKDELAGLIVAQGRAA